jgi:hypothetical protein
MGIRVTNLGQKCWTRGGRSYMMETGESEKNRPDDGHEGSCDAPHG